MFGPRSSFCFVAFYPCPLRFGSFSQRLCLAGMNFSGRPWFIPAFLISCVGGRGVGGDLGFRFFFRPLLTAPSRVRQCVVRTSGCASARPAGRVEGASGRLHRRELADWEAGFFFRFSAFPFFDCSARALPGRALYWLRGAGCLVFFFVLGGITDLP